MDNGQAADKRTRLLASKSRWSEVDAVATMRPCSGPEAGPCLRNTSATEDDLALGAEAAVFSNRPLRTVQGFLRFSLERQASFSIRRSLTSVLSTQSSPVRVMDVLNFWDDDPEELLLDLGFGTEEPDITVRIPERFINHPSKARGINIQVFLQAQQNRVDIENPDVRNRFRQIEVLQQVTTAFGALVVGGDSATGKVPAHPVSEEIRERRKRVGMLFRKASKKSLSQRAKFREQPPVSPLVTHSSSSEPPGDFSVDRGVLLKRASLSPLIEEQSPVSDAVEPSGITAVPHDKNPGARGGKEPKHISSTIASSHRSPGEPLESFELEEIQSFDEGSLAGSCAGLPEGFPQGFDRAPLSRVSSFLMRTNSCQSDSSGFLEEPFIPPSPNPGPELRKVLHAMSGDSTDGQQKSQDSKLHSSSSQGSAASQKTTTSPASGSIIIKAKTQEPDSNPMDCSTSNVPQKNEQITVVPKDPPSLSTTLEQDLPGLRRYRGQSTIPKTDLEEGTTPLQNHPTSLLSYGSGTTTLQNHPTTQRTIQHNQHENTTVHLESPSGHASLEGGTTLPNASSGLRGYGLEGSTLQKNRPSVPGFLREHTNGHAVDGSPVHRGSPGSRHSAGGSSSLQKDSRDLPDLVSDSSMLQNFSSTPHAIKDNYYENPRESSSTEISGVSYLSRSVSVQMRSNSGSSLKGSTIHSSSLGPSMGELRRNSFLQSHQSVADVENVLVSSVSSEHPSYHQWRSEDSSIDPRGLGPRLNSAEMGQSYDDDSRWNSTLWNGTHYYGPYHHKHQNRSRESQGYKPDQETSTLPYSMEDLMGMMRCLWKFRNMLSEIEERLKEEQSVIGSLSEEHRAEVKDILELRAAVKQEAGLLEQQLDELLQSYDDNFKLKMNRLLDEQSQLCTELMFSPSGASPSVQTSTRSVGIQCTLLTDSQPIRVERHLSQDDERWSSDSKVNKMKYVGYIKV